MAALCAAYWYPVYFFFRGKGRRAEVAPDVTQGFFCMLLQPDGDPGDGATQVAKFNPEHMRFRSWLRMRARWYFLNWLDHERVDAVGSTHVKIDVDTAAAEAEWLKLQGSMGTEQMTPDLIFIRCWAQVVVRRARARLEALHRNSSTEEEVDYALKYFSDEDVPAHLEQQVRGDRHDGAFRTARSRLKDRIAPQLLECLKDEVTSTMPRRASVAHEIKLLLHAFSE